jgi:hypothetical protein
LIRIGSRKQSFPALVRISRATAEEAESDVKRV